MSTKITFAASALRVGGAVLAATLLLARPLAAQSDSTARPEVPEQSPVLPRVPLSPFSPTLPDNAYRHSIEFDSTSNRVEIYESFFGTTLGQPRMMSLDDFLAERQREQERRMWEDRARTYTLNTTPADKRDDLEKIIGKGTSIDIPIPQNPIFSIFGPPTISINVNGSVNVSAGWQWDNNNLTSLDARGTTQSAPFFNQNIQVAVSGKVGDKLKLSADFDTQNTLDFQNQLKIAFGGGPESDDDIIQGVEAGNVQLQTPSTLIGGSQTLFGVKSSFKFGPLFLTTIASQKRGERKTVTVSGGSVKTQVSIKPYQYAPNHFWLDTVYIGFYDEYFSKTPPAASPGMQRYNVNDIEVYEQVKDASVPSQFKAIAYADLPPMGADRGLYPESFRSPSVVSGSVQRGQFIRLDPRRYEFDRQLGTLTIKSLQPDKMYAVSYRTNDATFGEMSNSRPDSATVAVLKLVYMPNMQPSFATLWRRQMKNIYQLQGVRNVDLTNSRIRITYGVPPDTSEALRIQGNPRLVTVLGVDRLNSSNEARPDGEFDIRSPYFFDPANGEVIFPSVEPFRRGLMNSLILGASASQFTLDAIYDQTPSEAQRDTRVSRYTIAGEIAGTGGNKINIGAFNLAPNSIKVAANGELLREGLDYRVDPVFGEVTLLSPKANSATGNLTIEYEQNDFYTVAQKTLLGLRADYDLFNNRSLTSKLGMTMMRYSQSLPTEKVQIYSGDEPVTNMMFGFDGSLEYRAKFLTKAIDALPFIDTKEPSALSVRGEWAMVLPNPNTKESLVESDGGKGAAYIDDFESGAKRQIQLGQQYTQWHPASPPVDSSLGWSTSPIASDSMRVARKGLFYWYNQSPANTETREIWPNRNVSIGQQKTPVMDVLFVPSQRGMYNTNFDYESLYGSDLQFRDSLWGGMMRSLSFYTTNLDEENIDYIEITMKVNQKDDLGRSKMYVDLGQISEDVIATQELSTEDGITPNNPQPDDILNEGEDVGIDSLSNAQEQARYPQALGDPDPLRDDYAFSAFGSGNAQDYTKVNGMEGNVGQERGPFPDTEDLNGNKSLDQDNTYFRYEVNLDDNPLANPQIVGGGDNGAGWRQYRIPIRTNYKTVGSPSFANVQFARLWIKSPTPVHIRIAEFNLVGSDWRNLNAAITDSVRDPKLDIAFVNLEDNSGAPDFYSIPTGVRQEREANNPDILKNEQSLSIKVKNLEQGDLRGAVRVRPRSFDVFNYKQMKFFLHGDGDMDDRLIPGQQPKVYAFMRFGWDSLNYYEYRVPLLNGWREHLVNFADLTAIKQLRSVTSTGTKEYFNVPSGGEPGAQFAVLGIPSLTRVQFIAFGIENNAYPGSLTTTMWVDELRVVGAEDANDWAATLAVGAKLADLGNVTMNFTKSNPNFHRLEERFGNRVESSNWSVNSVFQLEKFLPNDMKGSSIPFTYNHVERVDKPLYVAESDVEVDGAVRQILGKAEVTEVDRVRQADSLRTSSQTLVVQDAFAFSNFRLAFPGQSWWVRDIANRFTFGFNYDQIRERSPLVAERFHWNWDFKGQYSVNIPPNFDLRLFGHLLDSVPVIKFWKDFKVNFLPNTFTATTGVHRERQIEQLRNLEDPSPVVRDFRATRGAQFNWRMTEGGLLNLTTDYTLDARSSLNHLETDELGRQRASGDITRELFLNQGRLFNFGLDNDMAQSITFNTRPRIPFIPDVDRYVTPSARYKVTYNWQDQLSTPTGIGSYTKSAQWNSTSTLGLDVRLRQIGNILFGDGPNGRSAKADSTNTDGAITSILRYLIKIPILDFETIRFQYNQNNGSKNPGVVGSTGVSNLWGRSLLFRSESPDFGPGTAYQLGLTSDPHGTVGLGLQSAFPFIRVTQEQGIRAPNIYVQDNYSQKNTLTASTERALWPGASLNINWSVDWGYNKNYSVTTNANGFIDSISNPLTTGNLSRTYLSLPDLFFLNIFHNDIDGVVEEYARRKQDLPEPTLPAGATSADSAAFSLAAAAYNRRLTEVLSETFEHQLEALNWLPGNISSYLPRMNWNFQWNGLEKLPFLSDWAQSVSFRHAYNGKFNRNYRSSDEGEVPETQTVSRGFSPLAQLSITGKPDVFKGTATGSISYNTTTDFALVAAARAEISQELKNELQAQFSYQRRGLNFPIFGLNLKNDIEFALTFSYSRSNRKRFNLTDFKPEGNNDGSTRLSFRPSARYSLSNTVTASAFVSYDATIPDDEGSREIRRSTTKVGIDLRVGISGGR